MGRLMLSPGVIHAGNIVNEATTPFEVANMVSQCDEKEWLTPDSCPRVGGRECIIVGPPMDWPDSKRVLGIPTYISAFSLPRNR